MAELWEQQPDETMKAFAAFKLYRDMPAYTRAVNKVAEMLDVSVPNLSGWVKEHNWRDRAIAYDKYRDKFALSTLQTTLVESVQAVYDREGIELASLTRITDELLLRWLRSVRAEEPIDMLAFTRLLGVIERLQTMRRRNLNMPTTYMSDRVEEVPNEKPIYYAQPEVRDDGESETEV
jgi:hypothetical protein